MTRPVNYLHRAEHPVKNVYGIPVKYFRAGRDLHHESSQKSYGRVKHLYGQAGNKTDGLSTGAVLLTDSQTDRPAVRRWFS